MERIFEVYQRKSTVILYIIQCLCFIIAGIIFLKFADVFSYDCSLREFRKSCFENPIWYNLLGRGLLTYFGLSMLVFCYYLIKPLCLFYINDEGFWTRNYGFVTWQNLKTVFLNNVSFKKTVCFKVNNSKILKPALQYGIIKFINKNFADNGLPIDFAGNDNKIDETFDLLKAQCTNEN